MAKKANPAVVGVFVVGAAVLTVGLVLIFGGGEFFKEELRFVAHFEDSVKGLEVGAPIRFKGVPVGTVSGISAVWNVDEESVRIPVTLTFVRGAVKAPTRQVERSIRKRDPYELINGLIERGLRAELAMDSIVTGKLFVALEFYPESPLNLLGGAELPEMPTMKGGLAKLAKSLEELPIEQLIERAIKTIDSIEAVVSDPDLPKLVDNLNELVESLETEVEPLSQSAQDTLEDVRSMLSKAEQSLDALTADISALAQDLDAQVEPLASATIETLEQAQGAIGNIGDDPALVHQAMILLEELSEAARAIRTLADYLERHPEALLRGKKGQ